MVNCNPNLMNGFIEDYCLEASYVIYNGIDLSSPERLEKRREQHGCYGVNNGMVAFVISGRLYVTPFAAKAVELLKKAGFEDRAISVPFSVEPAKDYPGSKGGRQILDIWLKHPNNPLQAVTNYYALLMTRHNAFRRWCHLCDKAGKFYEKGKRVTLEDLINRKLDAWWQNKELYNSEAKKDIEEVQARMAAMSNDGMSNSNHRK